MFKLSLRCSESLIEDGTTLREDITRDTIDDAQPRARREFQKENIEGLTDHQRTLLELIESKGRIGPSTL